MHLLLCSILNINVQLIYICLTYIYIAYGINREYFFIANISLYASHFMYGTPRGPRKAEIRWFIMTSSNGNNLPRYWPFVRGIHRWPVNSHHKGHWRGALMFSLIPEHLSKQSWGWWCETPSHSLWRHCNVVLSSVYCVSCTTTAPGCSNLGYIFTVGRQLPPMPLPPTKMADAPIGRNKQSRFWGVH